MMGKRIGRLLVLAGVSLAVCVPALAGYQEGLAAFKKRDFATAAQEFESEVAARPNWHFAHYMLGLSYLQLKRYDDAVASLNESLEVAESDADKFKSLDGIGTAQLRRKQYDKAEKTLTQALALKLDDPKLTRSLGKTWSKLGDARLYGRDFSGAAAAYKQAQAKGADVAYKLGKACHIGRDWDCAVDAFDKALERSQDTKIYKGYIEAHLDAARASSSRAKKQELYGDANRVADRFLAAAPNDVDHLEIVAGVKLANKDYAAAESLYDKVIQKQPTNGIAYVNKAQVYFAEKQWDKANQVLKQGIAKARKPDDTLYRYLGMSYANLGGQEKTNLDRKIGLYQEAVNALSKAVQLDGRNPANKANLDSAKANLKIATENKDIEKINAELMAENKRIEEENARIEAENKKAQQYNTILEQEFGDEEEK